jgi:hypothetical protein
LESEIVVEHDVAVELEFAHPGAIEALRWHRETSENSLDDDDPRCQRDGCGEPLVGEDLGAPNGVGFDGYECV